MSFHSPYTIEELEKINDEIHQIAKYNQKLSIAETQADKFLKLSPIYNDMKNQISELEYKLNKLQQQYDYQNSIIESKEDTVKSLFLEINNQRMELDRYEKENYKQLFLKEKDKYEELLIRYKGSLNTIKELKYKIERDLHVLEPLKVSYPEFSNEECYYTLYHNYRIISMDLRLKLRDLCNALAISNSNDFYNNKKFQQLINENKTKNIRRAGRKPRFSQLEIETIKNLRESGMKLSEIAQEFNCSIGLIHKLLSNK